MDFSSLPKYTSRKFVPNDADLTKPETVKQLLQSLIDRSITSNEDLEKLVQDRSELEDVLSQAGSILYISMTCQTDDQERAVAYQDFIQNVMPIVAQLAHDLDVKFIDSLSKYEIDPKYYFIYLRNKKSDIEIFRKENIELATKVALLSQEYQTITGAMTAEFDGKEQTLTQIAKNMLDTDRKKRELAWRTIAKRRLEDKDKIEDIFDKMLRLRHQVAKNANVPNFRDYMFRAYHRFDYTADDCKRYHETVAEVVMPMLEKFYTDRKKKMEIDTIKPWDTKCDPLGREPLKPFEKSDKLIESCGNIFNQLDTELGGHFKEMSKLGLLDLDNRKGKAPGGYMSTLPEARKPFIFMNAVGVDQDMRTLLHESGHSFHAFAAAGIELSEYRTAPMEFCEVASMSMELLSDPYITEFYSEEDAKRSQLEHLEQVVDILPWVATVDKFQHWLYENPKNDRLQRAKAWTDIYNIYGGKLVDYSGLENEVGHLWHRQLHIFEVPFYYIEYAIAQLGALQVWLNAKKDPKKAIADYKSALALGGSKPLPQLFEVANIRFDFSKDTIKPLMDAIGEELEKLR